MVKLTKTNKNFTDISLSFQPNPLNGDITVLKDDRAISNALKNCVMIAVGETSFDNNFGSVVSTLLFEPTDEVTADDLKYEIKRTIQRNEPRVTIDLIRVNANYDAGSFDVLIQYKIVGYDETFNVDFILTPTAT